MDSSYTYVDPMLIAAQYISDIIVLKVPLNNEFEMKHLEASKKILVMEVQRNRKAEKLTLS